MSYTKGEWKVESRKDFDGVNYVGIERLDVLIYPYIINMQAPPFVLGRAGAIITADPLNRDKASANANLIAAAPNQNEALLEVLELTEGLLPTGEDIVEFRHKVLNIIRPALAKVEGGE